MDVNGQRKRYSKKRAHASKKAVVSCCENDVLGHTVLQRQEMIQFKLG